MAQVNLLAQIIFIAITGFFIWQFYQASNRSKSFLIIALVIALVQSILGSIHFYDPQNVEPKRFVFLLAPSLLTFIVLFSTKAGKLFLDQINLQKLTLLHIIRIPVELMLMYLFIAKTIPQEMTFEGRNFDIIAGLTAPIIYYFMFITKSISPKVLLLWNIICLGLLINIIITGILSFTSPFQQFGFLQPNIALGFFPFNLLPSVVVPIVMLAHLVAIRQIVLHVKPQ
jgi:hypothetical protein